MAVRFSGFSDGRRPRIVRASAVFATVGQWYFRIFLGCGTAARPFSWPTSERWRSVPGTIAS